MRNGKVKNAAESVSIRVLVVDDHGLALWALERLIEAARPEFAVIGTTDNLDDALNLARQTRPDVVLLGLGFGEAAVNLIPRLLKQRQLRVLAMTSTNEDQVADLAIVKGARGVLRKEVPAPAYLKAIRKVFDGELWLERTATGRIFGALTRVGVPSDPDVAKIAALTARERAIIIALTRLAAERHRKIADVLRMSEHTLRNHLSNIYAKLELGGRMELYLYAKKHGLDHETVTA
jgi:two-component system nitrate/nitrite response regulator NarL